MTKINKYYKLRLINKQKKYKITIDFCFFRNQELLLLNKILIKKY